MLHNRVWVVVEVATPEELAEKLTQNSWCLCNGFRYKDTCWLNDSTSEDSIQEYGIIREHDGRQLESITVSWCKPEKIVEYAEQAANGELLGPWDLGRVT